MNRILPVTLGVLLTFFATTSSFGLGQVEGADENLAGLESFGICALIDSRFEGEDEAESRSLAVMERVAVDAGILVRSCLSPLADADIAYGAVEINGDYAWTLQVILRSLSGLNYVSIWAKGGVVSNASPNVVDSIVENAELAVRDFASVWRSHSGTYDQDDGPGIAGGSPQAPASSIAPNDAFALAAVLSTPSDSRAFSNVGATREPGEPPHAGATGGASLWWSWRAPANGVLTVDTLGSPFDTLLAIYTGKVLGALQEVGANDDEVGGTSLASLVEIPVVSGTEYFIAVDGFLGDAGAGILSWSFSPRGGGAPREGTVPPVVGVPQNDRFAAAARISGSSGSIVGSNVGAGREPGEGSHDIFFATASVWWTWTSPSTGVFVFDTDGSSIDSVLAIYTGTGLASLQQSASAGPNASGSTELVLNATANTSYHIVVDGVFGEMGDIVLSWRQR